MGLIKYLSLINAYLGRLLGNWNLHMSFVNKMVDVQTFIFMSSFFYFPKLHRGATTLLTDSATAPYTHPHPPGCVVVSINLFAYLRCVTYSIEEVLYMKHNYVLCSINS